MFKRVPNQLARHELDFVAPRFFEQLDHNNQHRMFKLFRWEILKSDGSYAGYVDYPKLASAKLEAMTTGALELLLVSAPASDLYCPTYTGGATLAKESHLAKELATRSMVSEFCVS